MNDERQYEDKHYVQDYKLPTALPDVFKYGIRHKASRNLFWVEARTFEELAAKVHVGDWDPDPRNEREPGDEEEDEDEE